MVQRVSGPYPRWASNRSLALLYLSSPHTHRDALAWVCECVSAVASIHFVLTCCLLPAALHLRRRGKGWCSTLKCCRPVPGSSAAHLAWKGWTWLCGSGQAAHWSTCLLLADRQPTSRRAAQSSAAAAVVAVISPSPTRRHRRSSSRSKWQCFWPFSWPIACSQHRRRAHSACAWGDIAKGFAALALWHLAQEVIPLLILFIQPSLPPSFWSVWPCPCVLCFQCSPSLYTVLWYYPSYRHMCTLFPFFAYRSAQISVLPWFAVALWPSSIPLQFNTNHLLIFTFSSLLFPLHPQIHLMSAATPTAFTNYRSRQL